MFFAWYFQSIQPVSRLDIPPVDFEVKSGSSVDKIANDLSGARLIRSRVAFKLTVIRLGIASRIQAGYFRLSPSMSTAELADALTRAYAKQVRVTIPEGLRVEEIAQIVTKAFEGTQNNNFNPSAFLSFALKNEGKLFPDTYDFAEGSTSEEVINRLVTKHEQVLMDLKITDPKTIIIASLLEREAASSSEMPLVSGVIHNRLKIGMALQIDATVQYALGQIRCKKIDCDWWKQNLTREDLKINSPFNTYAHPGLPPSPISNPGRDALSAAINPAQTTAMYYLHDPSGKIHFADTLQQHNQNVCVYLKKDCN